MIRIFSCSVLVLVSVLVVVLFSVVVIIGLTDVTGAVLASTGEFVDGICSAEEEFPAVEKIRFKN